MTTKHVISETTETKLTDVKEKDIQPNAVDLRLGRVWTMTDKFRLSEEVKEQRHKVELHPNSEGYFVLDDGVYEIQFENTIKMGESEAGIVVTRSTLNRNGIFITSGLYDAGYEGSLAAALHVSGGLAMIAKGTRLGQFIVWDAETLHQYDGSYGLDENGEAKEDEQQYQN